MKALIAYVVLLVARSFATWYEKQADEYFDRCEYAYEYYSGYDCSCGNDPECCPPKDFYGRKLRMWRKYVDRPILWSRRQQIRKRCMSCGATNGNDHATNCIPF